MTRIWRSRYMQGGPHLDRCRHAVHESGRGVGFYQCSRKAVISRVVDGEEYGFCKQHDPVVTQAKLAAREAAWRAKWDELDRRGEIRKRLEAATNDCIDALRQIAAGHNDARALAAEVIARLDAARPS